MILRDRLTLGTFAAVAAVIWLRDRRWVADASDVLPAIAAIPLAVWLGMPWRWKAPSTTGPRPVPALELAGAILCLVAGIALNLTILLAAGWTLALWTWLRPRLPEVDRTRIRRLMVLPFAAFPWVTLDLQALGWWFRLSGAAVTQTALGLAGLPATREGTSILVQGMPIAVDAACSGLHVLQSLFIAGTFLAYLMLGSTSRYWWNLGFLLPLAWLANTARIITIAVAALTWGQAFAMGLFHTWGALFVLVLMFAGCWTLFRLQIRTPPPGAPPVSPTHQPAPG